jgi:hypothetical protein
MEEKQEELKIVVVRKPFKSKRFVRLAFFQDGEQILSCQVPKPCKKRKIEEEKEEEVKEEEKEEEDKEEENEEEKEKENEEEKKRIAEEVLHSEYHELLSYGLEWVFGADKYASPYKKEELEKKYSKGNHRIEHPLFFQEALLELSFHLQEKEVLFNSIETKKRSFLISFYQNGEEEYRIVFLPIECSDKTYFKEILDKMKNSFTLIYLVKSFTKNDYFVLCEKFVHTIRGCHKYKKYHPLKKIEYWYKRRAMNVNFVIPLKSGEMLILECLDVRKDDNGECYVNLKRRLPPKTFTCKICNTEARPETFCFHRVSSTCINGCVCKKCSKNKK